jgi:hypothetical protein
VYPVTQDFHNKMKADRRQVIAKAVIDYTDPSMDQSIEPSANEEANVSYPMQTADSVETPGKKWASLDGSCIPGEGWWPAPGIPNRGQMGWWGKTLAGTGGAFSSPYPTLIITHLPRPARSLKVVGDDMRQEYPVDFDILLYAQDNTLLKTVTVTGNTEVKWSQPLTPWVLDVAKQELVIKKWSHAGRQVKILEFFTSIQETYLSGDLVSIKLLEEREASQGSLPVGNISANEIVLALNNEDGKFDVDNEMSPLANLLKANRRIRVWLGVEEEYVPLGTFWSLDWDSPDDTLEATVTARDRMELLRKNQYESSPLWINETLYNIATFVLQDAGLYPGEWVIDPSLQNIVIPYAWFDPISHRDALRQIAEAGLATVYADRDGKIRIESFALTGGTSELTITEDEYFPPLSAPSKQEGVANEIVVATHPIEPVTTAVEVYKSSTPSTIPANTTRLVTVYYSTTPVMDAAASLVDPPAGVSIVAGETAYYAWGAKVAVQNTNTSDQEVIVKVDGKTFKALSKERVVARDDASILDNGVLQYEFPTNPLVQTLGQAEAIANALLASFKDPRRDIDMTWRGNPALLLGDRITVKGQDYHVIRQEIEWAGVLSARLTARKAGD